MNDAIEKVRAFHEKHGIEAHRTPQPIVPVAAVAGIANGLRVVAAHAVAAHEGNPTDPLLTRVRLLVEELSETVDAAADGDVVELLDGLADLTYVTLGTAVALGLPLVEAFDEVHRSNMTKAALTAARKGGKGRDYSPPRIAALVDRAIAALD